MRSNYLIWYLIPIVLIGGYILDVNARPDTMIPASYFTGIFSIIVLVLGFLYFLLRKYMKNNIFILDWLSYYTFIFPFVVLFFLFSEVVLMVNLNSDIMYFFSKIVTMGSYLYVLTQGLALVLLLYILVKKLTMQDKG